MTINSQIVTMCDRQKELKGKELIKWASERERKIIHLNRYKTLSQRQNDQAREV